MWIEYLAMPLVSMVTWFLAPVYSFESPAEAQVLSGFILVGVSVSVGWRLNLSLMNGLQKQMDRLNHPLRHLLVRVGLISLLAIPILAVFFAAGFLLMGPPYPDSETFVQAVLMGLALTLVLHLGYEALYVLTHWRRERERARQLEIERLTAELDSLKTQLNPHFLFNNLNTLLYLIEQEPDKARNFTTDLADTFRYTLQAHQSPLSTVAQEQVFIQQYLGLLAYRFEEGLKFSVDLPEDIGNRQLPSFALQLLVENAVKHNSTSSSQPLDVQIRATDTEVVVENTLQPRSGPVHGTGQGLKNLNRRYELLGNTHPVVERTAGTFRVRLPLL
jgi:uncharacterized membrane-anchored protein YhcB (DUF1043 family)